jgi:alpha-tubulin suppressor-like RCC1 family protein
VVQVAARGNGHTCARRTDGTLHCWGFNGSGQLGDGTTDDRTAPTPVTF